MKSQHVSLPLIILLCCLMCMTLLVSACGSEQTIGLPIVSEEPQYSVNTLKDVKYAEGLTHRSWLSDEAEKMDLLLDIYEPEGADDSFRPAVVFIHGGGFKGGDKSHAPGVDIITHFVQRGFVGFSINYRVIKHHGTIPEVWNEVGSQLVESGVISSEQVEQAKALYPAGRDAKAAIRWIYANAERLRVNTDYITVIGGSAGAVITMALGNTEESDYRDELTLSDDPTLATTHRQESATVHTLIDIWGSGSMVDAVSKIMGVESRWDATDKPVCIIHGTEDKTVTYDNALAIESRYMETGVNYKFYPLEGAGHAAWDETVEGYSLAELAFDFVIEQQPLMVR